MDLSKITIDNIIVINKEDRAQLDLLKKILDMGYYAYSPIWLKGARLPKGKIIITDETWRGKFAPDGRLVEIFPHEEEFEWVEISDAWMVAVGVKEKIPGTKIWKNVNGLYLLGKVGDFWMYTSDIYFPFYGKTVMDMIGRRMVLEYEKPFGFIATRTKRKNYLFVRLPRGKGRVEKLVKFYINNPSIKEVKIKVFKSRGKKRRWTLTDAVLDFSEGD